MQDKVQCTWEDFRRDEHRRYGTFQVSLEDLAQDLYFDDRFQAQYLEDDEDVSDI